MCPLIPLAAILTQSAASVELHAAAKGWHKADMLNALTNVRFSGQAVIDQPPLTNLDL